MPVLVAFLGPSSKRFLLEWRSNNNQYLTRQQPSGAAWENKSKKRKPKLVHGLFVSARGDPRT